MNRRLSFLVPIPALLRTAASIPALLCGLFVQIHDVGGVGDFHLLRLPLEGELLAELLAYLGLDVPLEHVGGEHVLGGHLCAVVLGLCSKLTSVWVKVLLGR